MSNDKPDPEVRPKRRKFSDKYKVKILDELDSVTESGQIGGILRREGLASSTVTRWRRQREEGLLNGRKRGPRIDPSAKHVRDLEAENRRLREELQKTKLVVDVQKKLCDLLQPPSERKKG